MGYFSRKHKIKLLKEMARKTFHVFAGLFVIFGYAYLLRFFEKEVALMFVYGLLLAYIAFEGIRLSQVSWLNRFLGVLLRQKEMTRPTNSINFLLAFIIIFGLVDFDIAMAAFLMLVFGDMISALMGVAFGETKLFGEKTYVGTLSGLCVNMIVGVIVLSGSPHLFIPMALTATVVELFSINVDDNLTIPLSSAFVGYLIVLLV